MEKFIRRGIALVCTIMMVTNPLLVYAEENSELKLEDAVDLESESNELDQEIQQNPEMEEVQETDSLDQNTMVTEEETEEIQNEISEEEITKEQEEILGVKYSAYLYGMAWQEEKHSGETAGTVGQNRALEALKIELENKAEAIGSIEYCAHVQNIGWQDYVSEAGLAGTIGRGLPIEAIRVRLTGELAEKYDIYYRVHSTNVGWLGWVKNDEKAGTQGYAYSVQAVEIRICEKNSGNAPSVDGSGFMSEETLGKIMYQSHVQNIGWQNKVYDGTTAGTVGRNLNLEALKMKITEAGRAGLTGSITCEAHVQDIGWQSPVSDWQEAGTTGKNKKIEAVKINLTEQLAATYDVYYRVHSANYGWLGWAKNGEKAGTMGYNLGAQAIEVRLYEKNSSEAPAQTGRSYVSADSLGAVLYQTHVQNIGWQNKSFYDGQTAGTTGRNLSVEAIKIKVTELGTQESNLSGSIFYEAHVQDIGWQGEVSDGQIAGTTGHNKKIEAIKIRLTEQLEAQYDIYYRVHSARFGWLDWTKNGEVAGTVGYNAGVEAIEIKLYGKGDVSAPACSERSYLSADQIGTLTFQTSADGSNWQAVKQNGEITGTTGTNTAIRQLSMNVASLMAGGYIGNVEYRLHLSKVGWQDWKTNGDVSGDGINQAEAVQIRLTGELEKYADIYYRTHVSNYGWLGWTKNGQIAGTTSIGYKLQAIQVKIVPKGNGQLKVGNNAYMQAAYRQNKGISNALGILASVVVSNLQSHEHDNFYLGTRYSGDILDLRSPNGDISYNGVPGMNCTSFVWYVLRSAGAPGYTVPHEQGYPDCAGGWITWQRSKAAWVPMYDFKTKSEMLRSGVLEKGDIIWIWNENEGGKYGISDTHHIGFFWGDTSNQDLFWHSAPNGGNQISPITGLSNNVSIR
ncbi:hypothetical protein LQE94_01290 [Mediterraneibacter sp. NSJ-151]|uniref:hypothetical protein n=1 Tax=Mediterraneibacter sp. NSJ-151 TaxID=2897708 RepID=UPI001F0A4415|nr:hypothetical protein [Mediterraneibacter sp. NSJ-151]MCH4278676.1 hypothetical protein [Mediterraneibacter sp. NSJ-151]